MKQSITCIVLFFIVTACSKERKGTAYCASDWSFRPKCYELPVDNTNEYSKRCAALYGVKWLDNRCTKEDPKCLKKNITCSEKEKNNRICPLSMDTDLLPKCKEILKEPKTFCQSNNISENECLSSHKKASKKCLEIYGISFSDEIIVKCAQKSRAEEEDNICPFVAEDMPKCDEIFRDPSFVCYSLHKENSKNISSCTTGLQSAYKDCAKLYGIKWSDKITKKCFPNIAKDKDLPEQGLVRGRLN